ncbi:MFS transporter [Hoylesella saccharolytica]|uniref:MFS transporter n=1 Tax=Hoylesella saccharolytica TaxID=633701 RepID=UPI0028E2F27B|nr:MFS transporter [Hoylesella saccharolytica]
MTEIIKQKLNDSAAARWTAMFIVAFTMMMGYFITDVMSPLEVILTKSSAEGGLGWSSDDYGFFSGSYGLINVFLLMLFFGGIILDKMGVRFTGIMSCTLMVVGVLIKYYGVTADFGNSVFSLNFNLLAWHINFSLPMSAAVASLGFAIFGVGCEITGITVSKVITKWFTGHELALAMGLQVALARLGTAAAIGGSLPLARAFGSVKAPILLGAVLLIIGLLAFLVYTVMDRKFEASVQSSKEENTEDEGFHFKDLKQIFTNPGFWLITLLCLLFYSGVFPFLKFATKLMITNYGVSAEWAGLLPSMIPFGTIFLTPLFGSIYDKVGKGATLMLIGSVMLTTVHLIFASHILPYGWFAVIIMILLGIAFSLVPSAMWPSVPKIIPLKLLGSAYSIIFYIQNIGLSLVPMMIGKMNGIDPTYTTSMSIFAGFGSAAIVISLILLVVDKKKHYGLQQANICK